MSNPYVNKLNERFTTDYNNCDDADLSNIDFETNLTINPVFSHQKQKRKLSINPLYSHEKHKKNIIPKFIPKKSDISYFADLREK